VGHPFAAVSIPATEQQLCFNVVRVALIEITSFHTNAAQERDLPDKENPMISPIYEPERMKGTKTVFSFNPTHIGKK
jgi:hypothetical protein